MKIVKRIIAVVLILFLLLMCLYSVHISNVLINRSNEQITQMKHLQQEVTQLDHKIVTSPQHKQDKVQVAHDITKPSITAVMIGTLATLGNFFKNISIFSLTSK